MAEDKKRFEARAGVIVDLKRRRHAPFAHEGDQLQALADEMNGNPARAAHFTWADGLPKAQ